MKKHLFALVVSAIVIFGVQNSWADKGGIPNDPHDKHDTSAAEMTLFGIAAASMLGAGTYLVRRAKSKPRT